MTVAEKEPFSRGPMSQRRTSLVANRDGKRMVVTASARGQRERKE
jgi:hypothetical protein